MRRIRLLRAMMTSLRALPPQSRKLRPFCTQTPSTSRGLTEAAKYEKKSPLEHVLLRPDTYIGGVASRESHSSWILDSESPTTSPKWRMIRKEVTYPPGLLKIFDEILVNAADNKARDPRMNRLEVRLNRESGRISVWNNGSGLPVEVHPSEGVYVPTMVFGSLFTSSNYDDNEIKTVGGRNGYGAKLCNIFSREFVVETVDSRSGRWFRQRWHDNMKQCDAAQVEPSGSSSDYTLVEFVPDLARFHIAALTLDVIELMRRRCVEVAATLPRGVDVFFNGARIEVDGFEDYVRMYSEDTHFLFLHPTPRWHVGVAKRGVNLPKTVSFVNNINTEKGGTHVDYVTEKVCHVIKKEVDQQLAATGAKLTVKPAAIRNQLSVFVNCLIENPSFESQTKETLTTKPKQFGSSFECDSKRVAEWAHESGLVDELIDEVLNVKAKKSTTTTKKASSCESVRDIVKLEDAAWAGQPGKGEKCTLILTEGDSAKALALSGLEVLGRERYGVFPLKGKLANVSCLDDVTAAKNDEIASLMRIIGLKFDVVDPDVASLRYGKLLILADQDEDGSHIKGLVINFLHRFWPRLLAVDGFVHSFRTPLLKAKRGTTMSSGAEEKAFFSMRDFQKWQDDVGVEEARKWSVKYYKGLGTSTSKEAREYFGRLEHHIVSFKYTDSEDDEAIRMAFDREKSEQRKEWIRRNSEATTSSDENFSEMRYKQFVDEELVRFGMADLRRSLPSLIDGLKPSQRKILWTLLRMDESKEMKVSQLAGAVAHSQSYHHGEESLVRTIIRMGQSFCGASNLPLLQPIGQFGTRHEGGNDAASARYIFTALAPTTRLLFPADDDQLLEKRFEEGMAVEPSWLCPIIPLILVNGTEGIGTGWSTKVANRSVIDVIDWIRRLIDSRADDSEEDVPTPFYEDFDGKIEVLTPTRFVAHGKIRVTRPERKNSPTFGIEILELPVGVWTSKYKEKLARIIDQQTLPIIDFSEHHTEKRVHFRLIVDRKTGGRWLQRSNADLLNVFKLKTSVTENPVLFDSEGKLKEFADVRTIGSEFFAVRKEMYERRLRIQKVECEGRLKYVENQLKFIDAVTNGTIELRAMSKETLENRMIEMGFEPDPLVKTTRTGSGRKNDFGYLLEMPLSRLTAEELHRLSTRKTRRAAELEAAASAEWSSTWHTELDRLADAIRRTTRE